MANELVQIDQYTPAVLFGDNGDIDSLIEKIRAKAEGEVFDVSTPSGRKEIASMAAKVARSKTAIDNMGKDYVAELKALPKQVDAKRKHFRDELDALKEKVRRPLTDFEEAQKARELAYADFCGECTEHSSPEYGATVEDLRELMNRLNSKDSSLLAPEFQAPASDVLEAAKAKLKPILEHAEAEAKAAAEQAEQQRLAAEAQAKLEAEQRAKEQAEAKRLAEENARLQAEREAEAKRIAEETAAREKKEAAEKAKRDKEAAAKQAEIDAANAKQAAAEAEAARIAKEAADAKAEKERKEQEEKLAAEQAEREAKAKAENKEHRRNINAAAKAAILEACLLTDEQAESIVIAIASGKVPAVEIKY